MSDKKRGFEVNAGLYGQVGGASLTDTIETDGITLLLGGQYSLLYSISGASGIKINLSGGVASVATVTP